MKIGIGYDVHKLVEGRKLIIGGIQIPYKKGLEGHSDADVLIHAIMDSILGALSKRDIGNIFPDTDMKFKDIDSKLLLGNVVELMKSMDYKIGNVDSIIVAQSPKMSPYIEKMRKILANIMETDTENVNIKATTTEHLGFEGQGLGVSAQAVCILERR
ncbi:2-C-methyl-D-erythritol 2,4-cyclodiphosphate synthase [Sedimentibacter sp. zth1]|uniref:2-C-methyl-D-erythritol 2,4-cyclodiphosphate synthase n=1 Tax=Sedimentibacter sp. zth1 TaxID=2816908 RepID=UPI001A92E615|nr:2-C-methyl-D-erythritol 2,4-cyclodiphosphate synthase [Sedimentibacter sp. zth1]QSX04903.1 2-C-methyl-D-erythritol 2,4-cyclodiphosphate synthase [Sedimentibacter sp. zth1]